MLSRTLLHRQTFLETQQDVESAAASVEEEAHHLSEAIMSFGDALLHEFDEECDIPPPTMKMKMKPIRSQQEAAKAAKEAMTKTSPIMTDPVAVANTNRATTNPVKAKDWAAPVPMLPLSDLATGLRTVFEKNDKSQCHTIDLGTLQGLLRRLEPSFTQEELNVLFEGCDQEEVNYEEFIDFVCFLSEKPSASKGDKSTIEKDEYGNAPQSLVGA